MTPRDLRAGVVQERLASMSLLLQDLDGLGGITAERLRSSRYDRHVVEHVLTQLVRLAVAINSHVAASVLGEAVTDYRSSFDAAARAGCLDSDLAVRLRPSVGLRNVVVHEYLDVDVDVVAAAAGAARQDYAAYVRSVAGWLTEWTKGRSGGLPAAQQPGT